MKHHHHGEQRKKDIFERFSKKAATISGNQWTFLVACLVVIIWFASGPLFGYSDTWQLVINTSTTIITFLMVFVIQHTQNKDTMALQLKVDELIRATEGAHNVLMDLEDLHEKELCAIHERYMALAADARKSLRSGQPDTNKPEVKEDFQLGE